LEGLRRRALPEGHRHQPPKDGYGVVLTLLKVEINKPISDDKFALEQPEGTTLQVLGAKPSTQPNALPAGDSSAPRKKTTH